MGHQEQSRSPFMKPFFPFSCRFSLIGIGIFLHISLFSLILAQDIQWEKPQFSGKDCQGSTHWDAQGKKLKVTLKEWKISVGGKGQRKKWQRQTCLMSLPYSVPQETSLILKKIELDMQGEKSIPTEGKVHFTIQGFLSGKGESELKIQEEWVGPATGPVVLKKEISEKKSHSENEKESSCGGGGLLRMNLAMMAKNQKVEEQASHSLRGDLHFVLEGKPCKKSSAKNSKVK